MTGGAVRSQLPEAFVARTAAILDGDHERFLASFDEPRARGLRVNPSKVTIDGVMQRLPGITRPVPWCRHGLESRSDASLGGHPAHLAGLFYLQEPSAMAVVEALDPQPGWRVADLAAAPGGKTTHLSARVGESGIVLANDVSRQRLRALHDNLDLWGLNNVITTSRPISELARLEGEGFDGVVLDAPCSSEALFRRDPTAIRHWSVAAVDGAARRQRELLADAANLVRPGGVLVYSTCSFGPEENEQQIVDFLASDDQWVLEDCARLLGVDRGISLPPYATELTARLWPHRLSGEGQFVARLRREAAGARRGEGSAKQPRSRPRSKSRDRSKGAPPSTEVLEAWTRFRRSTLRTRDFALDRILVQGDRAYLSPRAELPVRGVEAFRPGMPLGRLRPGRFAPDPALATSLLASDAISSHEWAGDDPRLDAYGRGEAMPDVGPDGWVLVAYERWGFGWGYRTGNMLKNHFPPHLRRQSAANTRRTANRL